MSRSEDDALSGDSSKALSTTETWPDAPNGDLEIGSMVGRYEVRHVLGVGGAGVVIAAHDAELNRRVAIKFLMRESEEARARLIREAKAMAQLSHPNVVTVYEVLRLGTRTGIVMELIDGSDLANWRKSPRTWREIVGVYVQAARGLAAAHRAGLVHRDFKPSNALIDADGVVRVTDFGLVRATDDGVSLPTGDRDATVGELTRTGTVLGTPAYMAPEQHAGDEVDERSDQWALACSLYTALYNQRPFAGDTVNELAVSVRTGVIRVEPTDTRVPRRIRAAVRRALSRSPDDRFATMDELIAAMTPRRRPWIAGAVAVAAIARGYV